MESHGQLGLFSLNDETEGAWFKQPFLAIDVETTGLDPANSRIIELALVPCNMPANVGVFSQLFAVNKPLPPEITQITGISEDMLKGQPSFQEKSAEVLATLAHAQFVVAYNAKFDRPFLESEFARINIALPEMMWVDPFVFICELDRFKKGKKLSDAAQRWGIKLEDAHRALGDAQAAGELMLKLAGKININKISDLINQQKIWQWQQAHSMAEYKKSNHWSNDR